MGVVGTKRYETAFYKVGNRACDYIPKHGMVVLSYKDVDVVLQLIIYSPNQTADENIYAWAWYERVGDGFDLVEVTEATFEGEDAEVRLPPKKKIGMIVYRKLTGN